MLESMEANWPSVGYGIAHMNVIQYEHIHNDDDSFFKAFSIAILIFFIIILSRIVYLLHFIYACSTDENCTSCVSLLIYLHQLNYVSPTLCVAITVWSLCYHLSDCIN